MTRAAQLQGPVPLANMPEQLWPHAKQIEADIADYLKGYNKDVQARCILAQELLRPVCHPYTAKLTPCNKSPDLAAG